jgi:RNA polymerase sigma-70 factor, ECF subfamily
VTSFLEPMTQPHRTVTQILRAIEAGDADAAGELFVVLYEELHSRAARLTRRQPKQRTLQATALLNEAYLRLVGHPPGSFADRDHFLACAAKAMRCILVDHSRRPRPTAGDETPLDAVVAAFEGHAFDIEKLELALRELETFDATMARAVDLRFFAGASEEETARISGLTLRTFQRRWRTTRAWLKVRCRGV